MVKSRCDIDFVCQHWTLVIYRQVIPSFLLLLFCQLPSEDCDCQLVFAVSLWPYSLIVPFAL